VQNTRVREKAQGALVAHCYICTLRAAADREKVSVRSELGMALRAIARQRPARRLATAWNQQVVGCYQIPAPHRHRSTVAGTGAAGEGGVSGGVGSKHTGGFVHHDMAKKVDASLMQRLSRKLLACKTGNCFLSFAKRHGAEEVKGSGGHIGFRFGGKRCILAGPSSMKKEMNSRSRRVLIAQFVQLGIVALPTAEHE